LGNSILKAGIIGYGRMGRIHDKVLKEFSDIKVVRLFDPAVTVQEDPRASNHVKEILDDPEIEIVYIATPQ